MDSVSEFDFPSSRNQIEQRVKGNGGADPVVSIDFQALFQRLFQNKKAGPPFLQHLKVGPSCGIKTLLQQYMCSPLPAQLTGSAGS